MLLATSVTGRRAAQGLERLISGLRTELPAQAVVVLTALVSCDAVRPFGLHLDVSGVVDRLSQVRWFGLDAAAGAGTEFPIASLLAWGGLLACWGAAAEAWRCKREQFGVAHLVPPTLLVASAEALRATVGTHGLGVGDPLVGLIGAGVGGAIWRRSGRSGVAGGAGFVVVFLLHLALHRIAHVTAADSVQGGFSPALKALSTLSSTPLGDWWATLVEFAVIGAAVERLASNRRCRQVLWSLLVVASLVLDLGGTLPRAQLRDTLLSLALAWGGLVSGCRVALYLSNGPGHTGGARR